MAKASRRLKVSSGFKVFVSRVSRNGEQQKWFAQAIGHQVGGCVAGVVRPGMSGGQIHEAVRGCAKQYGHVKKH